MPPKKRGRGSTGSELGGNDSSNTDFSAWLTFLNSDCLREAELRELFSPFGGVSECDGAVGGPADGWVMIGLKSPEFARTAIAKLKEENSSVGRTIKLIVEEGGVAGNKENHLPESLQQSVCLRCGSDSHRETDCRAKDKTCRRCESIDREMAVGHLESVHSVTSPSVRLQVVRLLGSKPFSDWQEANSRTSGAVGRGAASSVDRSEMSDSSPVSVTIKTKKVGGSGAADKISGERSDLYGGSKQLLAASDFSEIGGIKHFTETNKKILELVSHNNLVLMERLKDTVEDCNRQLKEKDDQIRRLQNLLNNHEENLRKLTNRLNAAQEFEVKVKKFFGENEEYQKKRVAELTKANAELVKKLEESEKARMDRILEESDTSKVKEQISKLSMSTDNVDSKAEQILAIVNGLQLGDVVRTDGAKGDGKGEIVGGSTATLLHNKVDKVIRHLAETSENQRKMNKVLQELMKIGVMKQDLDLGDVEEKKSKKKKDRDRKRSRSRSHEREKRRRSRSPSEEKNLEVQPVQPVGTFDHEFEEMKWALNMVLVGDGHWSRFSVVQDISLITTKMEKKVNFKILGRENETLTSVYDEDQGKLLVSLPKSCYKIGISVGTYDLMDPGLLTLQDAPMAEVKRRNEPKIKHKVKILKDMILSLIAENKQVILMIPPHGADRMEVHQLWEETILSHLRDIRFPKLKILNMAQIMRSTMSEFRSQEEYLDMWLSPLPIPRRHLSQYGTRRMFYALRQVVTAKTPQAAGMDKDWPTAASAPASTSSFHSQNSGLSSAIALPRPEEFPCPRCTKPGHPPEKCKSLDRICRKCNTLGHFIEVHDVTDERFRIIINRTLGVNLWPDSQPQSGDYDHHTRDYDSDIKHVRGSGDWYQSQPRRDHSPPGGGGGSRRIPLEKLAEMERRMGLGGEDRGGHYQKGWSSRPQDDKWYN